MSYDYMNKIMEIAIVTKEREYDLLNCIKHIIQNTDLPKSVIIIKTNPFKEKSIYLKIKHLLRLKGIKLKYKQINNFGISFARNVALSLVNDEIFGFIDDDEFCPNTWIKTAKNIFKRHPEVIAVTGYKNIYYKNNYWNLIWKELIKNGAGTEGYSEFATSSNTFYRTNFLRRNGIDYDLDFKSSSEDLVLCQKIKRAGGKIYYTYKLQVMHKFRSSMIDIIKQWFDYGETVYLFKSKYIKKENFSNSIDIERFIWQGIKVQSKNLLLIPGLLLIDITFFIGYFHGMIKFFLKNIFK